MIDFLVCTRRTQFRVRLGTTCVLGKAKRADLEEREFLDGKKLNTDLFCYRSVKPQLTLVYTYSWVIC